MHQFWVTFFNEIRGNFSWISCYLKGLGVPLQYPCFSSAASSIRVTDTKLPVEFNICEHAKRVRDAFCMRIYISRFCHTIERFTNPSYSIYRQENVYYMLKRTVIATYSCKCLTEQATLSPLSVNRQVSLKKSRQTNHIKYLIHLVENPLFHLALCYFLFSTVFASLVWS